MRTCPQCQRSYPDDTDYCSRDGSPLAPPSGVTEAGLAAGLSRRYRIVRRLGSGGMGTVFLAEQVRIGNRPVALKVLLRKLLDDPEFLMRFHNEAVSTARIHHPNVVTIYESDQADDGTPYIAMEYLEGETLRQALKTRGAMPALEAADIIQQAARGLHAAHKLGIIHRDLKPDNIFLMHGDEGETLVKVMDFGIAKLRESATHTMTGTVLGTPAYMSFEQAAGMRSDELDARSDLYSLGVVAYEVLTGRVPFHSETPLGYVRKHLTEDPPPFRTVKPDILAAPALERVVMKALNKDRDQRHESVFEFAREFTAAAQSPAMPQPSIPLGATKVMGAPPVRPEGVKPAPWAPPQRRPVPSGTGPGASEVGVETPPPTPPPARPAPYRPARGPAQGATAPAQGPPRAAASSRPVAAPSRSAPGRLGYSPPPVTVPPPKLHVESSRSGQIGMIFGLAGVALLAFAAVYWYLSQSRTPPRPGPTSGGPGSQGGPLPGQEASSTPTPKKTEGVPPGMVAVSGGTFLMGRDNARDPEETPGHSVTVAPFYLDKTLVTNEEYANYAHALGHTAPAIALGQESWPATSVSWYDADAFCRSLGKRLPTEAEWEFAARSADGRLYPWGNEFNAALANSREAGRGQPEAVGSRRGDASPFGALDMSGNVWQWCSDHYRPYPGRQPAFRIPADAAVIRGGSFESDKLHVTATTRNLDHTSSRSSKIGFRCAKSM